MDSSSEQAMGSACGKAVADLVIEWTDKGADPIDVLECVALSIGSILVNSQVLDLETGQARDMTAKEAGDVAAEFVEDGFKMTRMIMLEEGVDPPNK